MIKVPTVSLRGNTYLTQFYKLHEVVKANFPLIFSKLECTEIEGNLLFRWAGKDPKRNGILLMGHQDVVTADEPNWEKDPFSGEIADGNIHGRGAMDCKSTVFSEFQAIEELLQEGFEPPCDIYLATAVDEEISGEGAPKLVNYLKEKEKLISSIERRKKLLSNENYVNKAPEAIVNKEREDLDKEIKRLEILKNN